MMLRALLSCLLLSLACASVASAGGEVSYVNSTVGCLQACPGGDVADYVIVRDAAGNVIIGARVILDLSGCPQFAHCPLDGSETYDWDPLSRTARCVTNGSGYAIFTLHGGGTCAAGEVRVTADGVLLATRPLVSPDQNGDLVTDANDAALLNAKVGNGDPTADANCDGTVTADEVANYYAQHQGHKCLGVTPAMPRTWGRLKVVYR